MASRWRALLIAIFAMSVAGCFGIGATQSGSPTPTSVAGGSPSQPPQTDPAASTPLSSPSWYRGTLVWALSCPGIDPDGASPWPNGTTKVHELALPEGYRVEGRNPIELFDPSGTLVAKEGDAIEVTGTIPDGVSSFCSIGPKLVVEEIRKASP
jgi:hypothetical protein